MIRSTRSIPRAFAALVLILTLAPMAKAQTTYTWNDSTTDWTAASAWTSSGPDWTNSSRLTDAIAAFGSDSSISNQPTIGSSTIYVKQITVDNSSSAYTISGTGTINLGSGGLVFSSVGSAQSTSIAPAIALNASQTWDIGSNNTVTASGVVSGSFGLTKSGSGTLVLSNSSNSYSGPTTINAGTLKISADGNLGTAPVSATENIIFNGGTLQFGASFNPNSNRKITVNSGGATFDQNGFSPQIQGTISGSGAVTFKSSNVNSATLLVTNSSNSYTGTTSILSGRIGISVDAPSGSNGAFGNSTSAVLFGDTSGSANVTLDFLNPRTVGRAITVQSGSTGTATIQTRGSTATLSGAITLNKGLTLSSTSGGKMTVSGVISGAGALTKSGSNELVLSGTNTYSGGTIMSAGTLTINSAAGLGSTSGALAVNGGTLNLYSSGATTTGSLSGTGGTINLGASQSWTINQTTGGSYSGVLAGSGSSLVLGSDSTATLTLSGTNTYTGTTTINAGTLSVGANAPSGSSGALGNATSAVLVGNTSGSSAASLLVTGAFTVGRSITVQSGNSGAMTLGGSNTSGTATFSGAVTLNKDTTLTAASGGMVDFSGALSGSGAVTKSGSGTVVLSNTNTYTGGTTINAGTLKVSGDSNLGTAPASATTNLTFGGGSLQLGTSFDPSSNRNITLNSGGGSIDTNTFNSTFAQVISGSGGLTKAGSGTLTLSGTNTYSGGTTINAGTLQVGTDVNLGGASGAVAVNSGGTLKLTGNLSSARNITVASGGTLNTNGNSFTTTGTYTNNGTQSGAVTVGSGSTLGGTGTVSGNVTVNSGGAVSPGNSPGTLTVSGDVAFNDGSAFNVEVASPSSFDQLHVANGNVTIDSGATINITVSGSGYTHGEGFLVLKNDDGTTGGYFGSFTFNGASGTAGAGDNPAYVGNYGGFNWKLYYNAVSGTNYLSGGGQNIALVPVPEPGSILLVCAAAGGLGYAVRRRLRHRAEHAAKA